MGQTIAEKVFSAKVGRMVTAGEYVTASVDRVMLHEAFALSWMQLIAAGKNTVWDRERVVVILDHYVPASTERAASIHALIRNAVKALDLPYYYGEAAGIGHQVMMEKGHVRPGELIVGADSHTCTYGALGAAGTGIGTTEMAYVLASGELWFLVPPTIAMVLKGRLPQWVSSKDLILFIAGKYGTEVAQYKSIEFIGDGAEGLSVESRMTVSNMAVEIGAKFGFFNADEKTLAYLEGRVVGQAAALSADPGAQYEAVYEIDLGDLEPQVACPHSVGNVKPVSEIEGTAVHQAVLGSCTNGRFEDLKTAAAILNEKKVNPATRLFVYPASREVLLKAMAEGVLRTLTEAGAILCNPSCGPCFGGHAGLLAAGETCISSSNRNFKGRMGSAEAEVYLASPATVAASALKGAIADPRSR
jgi:3-isopropylmalate/(R)-2-methylmalate dehydratase large subunit